MTDTKALIAEARAAEDDWTICSGAMRELCSRLADALERAEMMTETPKCSHIRWGMLGIGAVPYRQCLDCSAILSP
jgi:phosphoserine phosphatase